MMVMVWKFLIFKFSLLVLLAFCACSQKPAKKKARRIIPKLQKKEFGPSRPSSHYKEVAKQYGLPMAPRYRFSVADLNGDFQDDLIVFPYDYARPDFYLREKNRYKKIAFPFKEAFKMSFLVAVDLDKDGINDVITVTLNQSKHFIPRKIQVFKGHWKKGLLFYEEIKEAVPFKPDSTSSVYLWDFNHDGHLDFFVANWWKKKDGALVLSRDYIFYGKKFKFTGKPNLLFDEDRKNPQHPERFLLRPSYAVDVCEDEKNLEILTSSTHRYKNRWWVWKGKNFVDKRGLVGADKNGRLNNLGGGETLNVACDYLNSDRKRDIILSEKRNPYDAWEKDPTRLLLSRKRDTRLQVRRLYPLGWQASVSVKRFWVADFNHDGEQDLLAENSHYPPKTKLEVWAQTKNGFVNQEKDLGIDIINPAGVTLLDHNADGNVDILAGQNDVRKKEIAARTFLFENRQKRGHLFYLQGKKSNRQGIGALVTFISTLRSSRRIVKIQQGGLPNQRSPFVSLVLKKHEELKKIIVQWPYKRKKQKYIRKVYSAPKKAGVWTLCESGKILATRRFCP